MFSHKIYGNLAIEIFRYCVAQRIRNHTHGSHEEHTATTMRVHGNYARPRWWWWLGAASSRKPQRRLKTYTSEMGTGKKTTHITRNCARALAEAINSAQS